MADNKNNLGSVDIEKMKKALAAVDKIYESNKKSSDLIKMQQEAWNGISSTIFGISGSDWFKKVPKTTEELANQSAQIKEIDAQLKAAGETLNSKFRNALPDLQKTAQKAAQSYRDAFKKHTELISADFKELKIEDTPENKKAIKEMVNQLKDIAKYGGDYNEIIEKLPKKLKENNDLIEKAKDFYEEEIKFRKEGTSVLTGDLAFLNEIEDENKRQRYLTAIAEGNIDKLLKEERYDALAILGTSESINKAIGEESLAMIAFGEEAEEAKKILSETTKEVVDINKGLMSMGKNFTSALIPRLLEFDKIIHETQKNTGIMFTENSRKMAELSVKTAEFGMTVKDTAEFMGALGEELRTTDFDLLAGAADDLKAVQLATGISAENLGIMAGEMMRAGKSSGAVKEAMTDANVMAKSFGISTKKVLDGMAKNITKMRTMGFQGGEKSLAKMVATAERLRMNVDEIFDVAKRARTIEGAMDMAAELQLAGGSFANINPMDLLASARKGPEELQKILTKMGADVGHFNKETGAYEFDPVDVDRLQIVADATGQSMDSLTKMVQKNAEDIRKTDFTPDIEGIKIKGLDEDAIKAQMSDALEMKDGKIQLKEGNIFGAKNLDDFKKMSKEEIKAKLESYANNQKTLEEQAKENQDFQSAVIALKDSLLNLIGYLEPVVEALTWVVQGLIKIAQGPRKWILALVATLAVLPMLIAAMGKLSFAMNWKNWGTIFKSGGIKQAMFGKVGGAGGATPELSKTVGMAGETEKIKPKAGAGLKDFLVNLSEGLSEFGAKWKDVLKGAATLTAALAILAIGFAASLFILNLVGAQPTMLLAFGAAIVELAAAFWLASKAASGIDINGLIMMGIGMGIIGLAMIPFVYAASLMTKINWGNVLLAVGILTLIVIGLGVVGYLMEALIPGLLAMAAGMLIISAALYVFGMSLIPLATGLTALAAINWGAFSGIVPALLGVSLGLTAFALAGLLFANPIMMLGMLLMIGALSAISVVLIPLATALDLGGKGLDSMATGVMKLSDSLSKLDFEKLGQLKEFSQAMAVASIAGGAMAAMVSVIEAIGKVAGGGDKGGAGAGGTRNIVVQLKMPNGRILEEHIVKDIDKAS